MDSQEQRRVVRQIIRAVAANVVGEGDRQTRPTFLTKPAEHFVAFFHFHKFSFGPCFRLHGAVRVLNDDFPAAALTGWSVEYAGRFHTGADSITRCVAELTAHLSGAGVRWHQQWSEPRRLVQAPPEALSASAREWLRRALDGEVTPGHYARSRKMLGLQLSQSDALRLS